MKKALALTILCLCRLACQAATFGTVVPIAGGATDLVLDEARGRLYIVDTTQNRIDVYATAQKRFLNPIPVGKQPLSAAISRDGTRLYVTIYSSSALEVVDLDSATVVKRVSLPVSGKALRSVKSGGAVKVTVPVLQCHEVVVFEY